MLGRELDASGGHQIQKRIVRLGQVQMHRVHHLLRGVRASNGQHTGVYAFDQVFSIIFGIFSRQACLNSFCFCSAFIYSASAQAARDDDFAVLGQGLAYGV